MKKINKNSFSKSKFIKKRGFTLIELIVVMAVIAILVLLAMPKFMNYAEEARVTRIKNDVKVAEDIATEYLVEYEKFPGDWNSISVSELNIIKDENRLYEKEGLATTIQSGEYVAIDKDFVKTKVRSRLKGTFYANLDAKVYYEDSKAGTPSNDGDNGNGDNNGDNGNNNDNNNEGGDNNNVNENNMIWEIDDIGVSTFGGGIVRLASDEGDIKYLVSGNGLADFKPDDWYNFSGGSGYRESDPVKMLGHKDVNINKLLKAYYDDFLLTTTGLYVNVGDWNNPYYKLLNIGYNVKIKDFVYYWDLDLLCVLYDNGVLKLIEYDNGFMEVNNINNVESIFDFGYITRDNKMSTFDGNITNIDIDYGIMVLYEQEEYDSYWDEYCMFTYAGYMYMQDDELKMICEDGSEKTVSSLYGVNFKELGANFIKDNSSNIYRVLITEDEAEIVLVSFADYNNEENMCIDIKQIDNSYIVLDMDGNIYRIENNLFDKDVDNILLTDIYIDEKATNLLGDSYVKTESGKCYSIKDGEYIESLLSSVNLNTREIIGEVVDIYDKNLYIDSQLLMTKVTSL